jgi:predicted HTH domain antitoxin
MKTASFRLEKSQDEEIEEIAQMLKTDKSSAARRIIDIGIKEIKTQEAINQVRLHRWTVWKAATYCGESYRSFLKLLRAENVPFPLSVEDLKREFDEDRS